MSRNAWSGYVVVSSPSVVEIRKRSQVREQISRWSINAAAVITVPLPYNVITLKRYNGATYSPRHGSISIRGNIARTTG
ncbi:unnamed protein product [Lasius platythorax]|uniref:Uncharacterized protein n=1 Tax=Lasius platythorax TaxID=488582 RepID=A0AAV2NZD9_9HYME